MKTDCPVCCSTAVINTMINSYLVGKGLSHIKVYYPLWREVRSGMQCRNWDHAYCLLFRLHKYILKTIYLWVIPPTVGWALPCQSLTKNEDIVLIGVPSSQMSPACIQLTKINQHTGNPVFMSVGESIKTINICQGETLKGKLST